ncbi:Methyl sulfide methyltransferase-associated sensor [uncultured archaeon]|nr:Methyl sulfide methyltransferase-associated sensor [uncultured archaeon]
MIKINHALKVLLIVVTMVFLGQFLESYKLGSAFVSDYFEVATELLPLVLSFSIFAINWFAYGKSRDNHSLFLGVTFFVVGILDLFHMLSYPYMPDFITKNSLQKAEAFWIEARIISVFLLLISVYIYKDTFPNIINKPILYFSAISLAIISMMTMFLFPGYLPQMLNPDESISSTGIILLLITGLVFIWTIYLYTIKLQRTGQKSIICLIYGFILLLTSNSIYLYYDYSGHLLKAAGLYFVYLAMFKSSIEQPYGKLADTEHKLRDVAEKNYRNLFDNANDAIIITDLEDMITSWNRSAEKIFGWNTEEVIGKKLSQLIVPPHLVDGREQIKNNVLSGHGVTGFDAVLLRKDGSPIDVSMTISILQDSDQNIIGLSSIIRDITERKKAEEQIRSSLAEKEVLLREIHHRVKNNMQIISSLLSLQSEFSKDSTFIEMFKESRNRITSMALIHEKLYQSQNFTKIDINGYIKDLVNGLFQSYGISTSKIALNLQVEDVPIGIDSAIPCGLVINELVTNSMKYAFPGDKRGELKIILHSIGDNMIELVVSDDGVGIPKDMDLHNVKSLGLHLVTILSENQLQGEIHLNLDKGTEFRIKFRGVK